MGTATPEKSPKFPLLISYAYLRKMKPAEIDFFVTNPKIELLVDSGAFTALNAGEEIDLKEYMDFVKSYREHLFGYFALDKLGDTKTTLRNLDTMLSSGLKPIPIHVRGASERDMDYLFSKSRWVGLGGFRRPHRGPASKEYVKQKMAWAKNRNVHWLGYTTKSMMYAFKPYSVDCSAWTSCLQYGGLKFYFGNGHWSQKSFKHTDFKDGSFDSSVKYVLDRCGFTVDQAKNPDYWKSNEAAANSTFIPLHVSIYSWTRYIMDVRMSIGTRLFMACAQKSHMKDVYRQIQSVVQ